MEHLSNTEIQDFIDYANGSLVLAKWPDEVKFMNQIIVIFQLELNKRIK